MNCLSLINSIDEIGRCYLDDFFCVCMAGLLEGSGPRHWIRRSGEVAVDGALDWRAASARWTSSRDGSQEVQKQHEHRPVFFSCRSNIG